MSPVQADPLDLPTLIEETRKAVVQIEALDSGGEAFAAGTGYFIDSDIIVTNWHVVEGAAGVSIRLEDGRECEIEGYVALSEAKDLILLQSKCDLKDTSPLELRLELPRVGENVIAIGNSLAQGISVTDGIVSALRDRKDPVLIQISTPISSGNSGGPVLDEHGRVIGVATSTAVRGQNMNFAVASHEVAQLPRFATRQFKGDGPAMSNRPRSVARDWMKPFVAEDGILGQVSANHRKLIEERAVDHIRLPGGIWIDLYRTRRARGQCAPSVLEDDGLGLTQMSNRTIVDIPPYAEVVGGSLQGFVVLTGTNTRSYEFPSTAVVKQVLDSGFFVSLDGRDNWDHIRGPIRQGVAEGSILVGDFWLRPAGNYEYINKLGELRNTKSYDLVYLTECRVTPEQYATGLKNGELDLVRRVVSHRTSQRTRTKNQRGLYTGITTREKSGPLNHEYKWFSPVVNVPFQIRVEDSSRDTPPAEDHSDDATHFIRMHDGREFLCVITHETKRIITADVIVGSFRSSMELDRRDIASISELDQ